MAELGECKKGNRLSELYVRAKAIALDALAQPASGRRAWLAARCAGEPALQQEAEWLLAAADLDSGQGLPLHPVAPGPMPMQVPPMQLGEGAQFDAAQPGQYRILRLLGEGGMGMVYLAERHDGDSRQPVALKLISGGMARSPHLAARLADERRILALLHHPNIAHLVDGGIAADGQPFIAMEYIEGERIDHWCERHALPLRERLKLFLKVCAAVEHAHQRLVIHRDLKPANILVDAEGEPKLLDFGIARLVEGAAGNADPTRTAHRALTLAYASPEHVEGLPLTTATDIWSLGVLLYELLTGMRPHQAMESGHLLPGVIVSGDIRPPSTSTSTRNPATDANVQATARMVGRIGADIDAIVLKALRKDPAQRYPSVAALADDLRRFLESRPVSARRGHALYRLRRFAWRQRWKLGAAAVLVLALGGYLMDREQKLREVLAERNKSQALSGFMTDLFANADPSHSRGEQVTVKEVLDRGAIEIRKRKDLPGDVRADLLLAMAESYVSLDLLQTALPITSEALDLKRASGASQVDVAEVLQQVSNINANLGENAKAVAAAREGQTMLSRDDPDQFPTWAKLRMIELRSLDLQGQMAPEALIPPLRELLTILEKPENKSLAVTRANGLEALSNTLMRANDPQGAVRMQEQAVAYAEEQVKDAPETVLTIRSNLGSILIATADTARGVAVLEAVDRDYVRLIGENAGSRATLLNDIATGYDKLGDDERALQYGQKALAVAHKAFGTQNRVYLQLAVSQAMSLGKKSRHAEAEALLRETLPHLEARSSPGVDAVNHAYALAALAELLVNTGGDAREALRLARQAGDVMQPLASGNFMVVYYNAIRAEVRARLLLGDKPGATAAVTRFASLLDSQNEPAGSNWRTSTTKLQAMIAR